MKVDERYLNAIDAKLALDRSDGLAYTENLGSVDPYWDDKWVAKTLRDLVGAVRGRDQTIETLRAENERYRGALNGDAQ